MVQHIVLAMGDTSSPWLRASGTETVMPRTYSSFVVQDSWTARLNRNAAGGPIGLRVPRDVAEVVAAVLSVVNDWCGQECWLTSGWPVRTADERAIYAHHAAVRHGIDLYRLQRLVRDRRAIEARALGSRLGVPSTGPGRTGVGTKSS